MSNKLGQKKRKEILQQMTQDPNDSWARVELYRWEHGELPPQNSTCKQLNIAEGLSKMADAFKDRDQTKWPAPFNVASVLKFASKLLKENNINE